MDAVSAALILAVAGGAGGAVGDQAWRGLVALVHHPVHRDPAHQIGGKQLAQLQERPDDESSAAELARILEVRAAGDHVFRTAVDNWRHSAEELYEGHRTGAVNNTVSGGTFHGPVIQTGGSVHFSAGTPPPPAEPGS